MKSLLFYLFFFTSLLFADVGKVSSVAGDAGILRGERVIPVFTGISLEKSDVIKTSNNSKLQIIFDDNTIVTLGKNTTLDVSDYIFDTENPKKSKITLNFLSGTFKTISGKIGKLNRKKFKLKTKSASVGIRGTVIFGNQKIIACTSGEISVFSAGKEVIVSKGEYTKTILGKIPTDARKLTKNILTKLEKSIGSTKNSKKDQEDSDDEDEEKEEQNSATKNSNVSTDDIETEIDLGSMLKKAENQIKSKMDTNKIYVYKNSKNNSNNDLYYYNPKLKSFSIFNKNIYNIGVDEVVFGYKNQSKNHSIKYDYDYINNNINSIETTAGQSSISFEGNQFENLNIFNKKNIKNKNIIMGTTKEKFKESLSKAYLISKSNNNTIDEEYTLNGFLTARTNRENSSTSEGKVPLKIKVIRQEGRIKTNSNINLGSNTSLLLNAKISDMNAYYINDDMFGAKFISNTSSNTGAYTFVEDSGYIIALPDGKIINGEHKLFDINDNPLRSDDDSSWGYWNASFEKNSNQEKLFIQPNSAWIAGEITPSGIIQNILSNQTPSTYNFKGKVLGNVRLASGNIESIKMDDISNKVDIIFNLGAGANNMNGSAMKFKTNSTNWNLNMQSNNINTSGFDGNLTGNGIGNFKGKFFGKNEIKSVGGTFNVTNVSQDKAQGVFKAIK